MGFDSVMHRCPECGSTKYLEVYYEHGCFYFKNEHDAFCREFVKGKLYPVYCNGEMEFYD